MVRNFWREKIENSEVSRFSQKSREAFLFLQKVFKYNEGKRDGSIINKVRNDSGVIVTENDEVNRLVLLNLKKIQTKDDEPDYPSPTPFPLLNPLSYEQMTAIVQSLATHKALSMDGISDNLFSKKLQQQTILKLRDLWTTLAKENNISQIHFDIRLIPLNKQHPLIPSPQDCRPIAMASPLVKLLESYVKPKLDHYMSHKLYPG
jgi:hypothetical protein